MTQADSLPPLPNNALPITFEPSLSAFVTYKPTKIDLSSFYAASIPPLLNFAYDNDFTRLLDPVISSANDLTLRIDGELQLQGYELTPGYTNREYAIKLIYSALSTVTSTGSFFESEYFVSNSSTVLGNLTYASTIAPPTPLQLPWPGNRTPFLYYYSPRWYHSWFDVPNHSSSGNLSMALTTMMTKVALFTNRQNPLDAMDTFKEGYSLSIKSEPVLAAGQALPNLLDFAGVLDMCGQAYTTGLEWKDEHQNLGLLLGLEWVDEGGQVVANWTLRYEGVI